MAGNFGIIAEDHSDVECAKILVRRMGVVASFRHFIGHGCGKITRKCNAWAQDLANRGCSKLLVIHDLDQRDLDRLMMELADALSPCPIKDYFICIPTQELEAWLLSDAKAIKKALNLKKDLNEIPNPEKIDSPKELLEKIVNRASNREKQYINTKHNPLIAANISLNKLHEKCSSFRGLKKFIANPEFIPASTSGQGK